jgi:hypothetical protein
MLARQADLLLLRDERNPDLRVGAPRINMHARQADLHLLRDERNPDLRVGAPRINMHARQADLGKSLMDKDPKAYTGFSRASLMLAQANHGRNGLEREVNQRDPIRMAFRAELLSFVDSNKDILVGFLFQSEESTFLTLPDAYNYIWGRVYHKEKNPLSHTILSQMRLALTWTDKLNVGREPFILCYGFNIYTRRSPQDGSEPRPRLFPSDVVCYKCAKDKEDIGKQYKPYASYRGLHLHFKGNLGSGKDKPHVECENFYKSYSN